MPDSALSRRNAATISSVSVGRSPAITSSSSSSFGWVASARATSSRLRSGSVRLDAGRSRSSHMFERAQRSLGARAREPGVTGAQEAADHRVLDHRHVGERPHDLEGAADARRADLVRTQARDVPAREADRSAVRHHRAGDEVEQRGLAGAVGPDQRDDLALVHLERGFSDRLQPAEALRRAVDHQHRMREPGGSPREVGGSQLRRHAQCPLVKPRRRAMPGQAPCGMNMMDSPSASP